MTMLLKEFFGLNEAEDDDENKPASSDLAKAFGQDVPRPSSRPTGAVGAIMGPSIKPQSRATGAPVKPQAKDLSAKQAAWKATQDFLDPNKNKKKTGISQASRPGSFKGDTQTTTSMHWKNTAYEKEDPETGEMKWYMEKSHLRQKDQKLYGTVLSGHIMEKLFLVQTQWARELLLVSKRDKEQNHFIGMVRNGIQRIIL